MDMALSKKLSLYLSTKNTILKKYDDRYGSSMFLQARGNPCSFKYPLYNMQAVDTNVHLQVISIHSSIVLH
jgi:isocitrate dehydrogenase